MPFKKGASGNPSGRPKRAEIVSELARKHTAEALQTIVHLMQNADDERTRLAAATALLDRGYGKPPQAVDLESKGDIHIKVSFSP